MAKSSERRLHSRGDFSSTASLDTLLAKMQQKDDFNERNEAFCQPPAQFPGDRSKPFVIVVEQGCHAVANKWQHDAGEFFRRESSIFTALIGVELMPPSDYLLGFVSEAFQQRM
jgi:hypothetical protein